MVDKGGVDWTETFRGDSGCFVKGKSLSQALSDKKNLEERRDTLPGVPVLGVVQEQRARGGHV